MQVSGLLKIAALLLHFLALTAGQTCPKLSSIANGKVKQPNPAQVGDKARYKCKKGYTLEGKKKRKCILKNGNAKWKGKEPKCIKTCETCVDLVFVVDGGANTGNADWSEMLLFLQTLVNAVDSANNCADALNVAVVQFGQTATVNIPLTPSSSISIDPSTVPLMGVGDNIVAGMELADNAVFGPESDCVPCVIVITTRETNTRVNEIASVAAALRTEADDNIACIGITSEISQDQLDDICPNASDQLSLVNFDELVDKILEKF